jgi:carboxymethylenebutenolidase
VPALVYSPTSLESCPAVVLAAEAFGINEFTRLVASRLALEGYVVVVPDYYRGNGLTQPEGYDDFTEVMQFIEDLDFVAGTHDIVAGVEYARGLPAVDPQRVSVWGYCTGGTLAMMAASLVADLDATVLFFPSQPTFPELTMKRPVQPIDLLWNISSPVLLIYGDQDAMLVSAMPEIRRRLEHWQIEHEVRVYPGAGHAFSAPVPPLRNDAADVASWADALAFLRRHGAPPPPPAAT